MKNPRSIPAYVTVLLFALALGACMFGVFCGEMDTVMQKAVAVCLECIGIG